MENILFLFIAENPVPLTAFFTAIFVTKCFIFIYLQRLFTKNSAFGAQISTICSLLSGREILVIAQLVIMLGLDLNKHLKATPGVDRRL